MTTATKTRKPTEITSPVVYRCTDRKSGEIFYAVKSDSTSDFYKITYNTSAHRYECSCPATCECKHLRAVRSVVLAKAELKRQELATPAHETTGTLPSETQQRMAEWNMHNSPDAYDVLAETKTTAQEREAKQARGLAESYSASWYPQSMQ